MDEVANWQYGPDGGLILYNGDGQVMGHVPKAQANAYINAFTNGLPGGAAAASSRSGGSSAPSGGGGSSAPTWAQQQANAQDARDFAQTQSNWQETYNYNKARGDQQMQLQQAELALREKQRIDALHGPQDYIKYWRASRGQADAGATGAVGSPVGAPATAATASSAGAPNWSAAFQNVKTGVPAGAQTISDAPGGPAWAWNDKPSAGYDFGVQSIMPKTAAIATSGLPYQTKPVSLSDWATQQMRLGGIKF